MSCIWSFFTTGTRILAAFVEMAAARCGARVGRHTAARFAFKAGARDWRDDAHQRRRGIGAAHALEHVGGAKRQLVGRRGGRRGRQRLDHDLKLFGCRQRVGQRELVGARVRVEHGGEHPVDGAVPAVLDRDARNRHTAAASGAGAASESARRGERRDSDASDDDSELAKQLPARPPVPLVPLDRARSDCTPSAAYGAAADRFTPAIGGLPPRALRRGVSSGGSPTKRIKGRSRAAARWFARMVDDEDALDGEHAARSALGSASRRAASESGPSSDELAELDGRGEAHARAANRVDYEWQGARLHAHVRARRRGSSQLPLSPQLSRPAWLQAESGGDAPAVNAELSESALWRESQGDSDDGELEQPRAHRGAPHLRPRRRDGRRRSNPLRVHSDALVRVAGRAYAHERGDDARVSNDERAPSSGRRRGETLDEPRRLLQLKQQRHASSELHSAAPGSAHRTLSSPRSTLSSPRSTLSSPRSALSSPRPAAPFTPAVEAMALLARGARVSMRECLDENGPTATYRCVVRGATFACRVFCATKATLGQRAAAWREVTTLASLSHRNVEQFAGQVNVGDELRLFVEFSLTTLADVLAVRRNDLGAELSADECATMALEVGRGLRYLHNLARPFVHLNLRPSSVLYQSDDYSRDFVLKLTCFTEARQFSSPAAAAAAAALLETNDTASGSSSSRGLQNHYFINFSFNWKAQFCFFIYIYFFLSWFNCSFIVCLLVCLFVLFTCLLVCLFVYLCWLFVCKIIGRHRRSKR